jgi:hypothetical protein
MKRARFTDGALRAPDQFGSDRRFLILNIVDDVTRECPAVIPDTSISGRRAARELTPLIERC